LAVIGFVTICQPPGGVAESGDNSCVPEPEVNLNRYRCPVCGEMVDASSAEQILIHHEHVTHPRRFLAAKALAAWLAT
jgi:hypothetical protein